MIQYVTAVVPFAATLDPPGAGLPHSVPDGSVSFWKGWGQLCSVTWSIDDDSVSAVGQPVEGVLADHGLRISDVAVVMNTHLHFDHCGGNRLFARIPLYVQSAEYRAAHEPRYTVGEWVDFEGARYIQIEGEAEIAEGVTLIPTPGHTVGNQSVLVETGDGLVVIAAQAIFLMADFEQIRLTGKSLIDPQPEPDQYIASARRLIALRPRRVLFSHDSARWDRGS